MEERASIWGRSEDKIFETALVKYAQGTPNRWAKIADLLPLKTALQVETHYHILMSDVGDIEAGLIPLPDYTESADKKKNKIKEARKPATQWTAGEHKRFLEGLNKYGKGDWKSIARQCVKTRSATQVASHAQKYFIHLDKDVKNKKRSSIYDVSLE
ncbi:unnamed protein product [Cuscuta epithymum]|uniref:Uncharacterized protein n=1 Tax=Cuscuta epithymum TaxID=186058 RepID=A0AAV0FT37_9ASTE|nr:unnamed protein product [Cuscuta epithymum]